MTNAQGRNGAEQDASTTIGVGGATSGQAGATPSHETQQETGGSGGEQLTASQGEVKDAQRERTGRAQPSAEGAPAAPRNPAEPVESSMHSGARGAFDTRSEQAGGTGTGIGAPESGANQSPADLAPPADGKA
ncbi:MAG: hypothetical protein AB1807_14625 [Pseudomonadota bacterium]